MVRSSVTPGRGLVKWIAQTTTKQVFPRLKVIVSRPAAPAAQPPCIALVFAARIASRSVQMLGLPELSALLFTTIAFARATVCAAGRSARQSARARSGQRRDTVGPFRRRPL